MKKFNILQAVYCYHFPEVNRLVNMIDSIPKRKLYQVTTPISEAEKILNPLKLQPALELPAKNGFLDLDMIHEPIITRISAVYDQYLFGLNGFSYRYPTHGSSEGIFHYLALLKTQGITSIYTLEGEYEGYREYAKDLGMSTIEIKPWGSKLKRLKPGFWFISNPNSRDGNILPDQLIDNLCKLGHQIALDLAYFGLTKTVKFDITHPNIKVVFLSFSKPYGLFRERVGFLFSRQPIDSLYANKWFDRAAGLLLALKITEDIGPFKLYRKYYPIQKLIINQLNSNFGLHIKISNSLLLGYLTQNETKNFSPQQLNMITQFKRGANYRFCLTPYFEKWEKESKI